MRKLLGLNLLSLPAFLRPRPTIVSVQIEWVHPDLAQRRSDLVTDPNEAQQLFEIFEGLDADGEGRPCDTPFYDAILTFATKAGKSYQTKVYLPRYRMFPGMWKHPGGVLFYLEPEKEYPLRLVALLESRLPVDPIYPRTPPDPLPDVPFNRGIPDFRSAILPIRGDFR